MNFPQNFDLLLPDSGINLPKVYFAIQSDFRAKISRLSGSFHSSLIEIFLSKLLVHFIVELVRRRGMEFFGRGRFPILMNFNILSSKHSTSVTE